MLKKTRSLTIGAAVALTLVGCCHKPSLAQDELAQANLKYESGDYAGARVVYVRLIESRPGLRNDLKLSIALCQLRQNKLADAAKTVRDAVPACFDDRSFIITVLAKADDPAGALDTAKGFDASELKSDTELLERLARCAAKTRDRQKAWQFYSMLEANDPFSDGLERLRATGEFDFNSDFFGYGVEDIKNYSKGLGGGALDNIIDTAKALWQLVRHPIKTYNDVAEAVSKLCTRDNLALLVSPRRLATVLGDTAARLYWDAWNACKASVVREYGLDAEQWDDQKPICEIAAGRMFGYCAPDLALVIIPFVKAPKTVLDATRVSKEVEQLGVRVAQFNRIGRSAEFLSDVRRFPLLAELAWPSLEDSWRVFKTHPQWTHHLDRIAGWLRAVRDVPGAERLAKLAAGRLHLDDGYLFQLERAAEYAKRGELQEIGRKFRVSVALPGRPVKTIIGDADLVLRDGTLIETKARSASLSLSDLHEQLLKYNQAVKDGQFKRIRVECSGGIDPKVYERCKELSAQGTPVELVPKTAWTGGVARG